MSELGGFVEPGQHVLKHKLPQIPNLYTDTVVPILPENVPIHLFNESQKIETDNEYSGGGGDLNKTFRNTTNLVLPLFDSKSNDWPEKSPYACWNCDCFFDGTPIGIPDKVVDGKFYCTGNYCDFACAGRYLKDRCDGLDFWNKYSLLCIMYQQAYGLSPEDKAPIAPKPEALSKKGGKYSYDEYHGIHKQDKSVEVYKLPLVPIHLHIEEVSRATNIKGIIERNNMKPKPKLKQKKVKRFIPIDPEKLSQAEENIRLRKKERIESNYTLHNCFTPGN